MIHNATLLSIATPAAPDGAGDATYATGPALRARCLATAPQSLEKFQTDASERRAMLAVTVSKRYLADALELAGYSDDTVPAVAQEWSVRIDGSAAITYRVEDAADVQAGTISHWRVTLKSV